MDGAGQVSVGDANDRTQIIQALELARAMIHWTEVRTTRACMCVLILRMLVILFKYLLI